MESASRSEVMTPPKALLEFCTRLEGDTALQAKITATENPQQILDIASSLGFQISVVELRVWSRELTAPHFPWAAKRSEWRRNFFTRNV
jgi:predicted ribosomally synthesized peptide with nif11-like leader